MIVGLDHVSLLIKNKTEALAFYCHLLGLEEIDRPVLGFDGIWLRLGQAQSLHLMCLPSTETGQLAPAHAGRDRHIALLVNSLEQAKQRLNQAQVPFTTSRSGRASIFCRDPDGNGIELMQMP
ncbi:MAG: VOC family protein [Thiotrichales bacterium]|jgi:glyoxylase I family protein|nr:VOC family protein [Thiotrichales bacterium]